MVLGSQRSGLPSSTAYPASVTSLGSNCHRGVSQEAPPPSRDHRMGTDWTCTATSLKPLSIAEESTPCSSVPHAGEQGRAGLRAELNCRTSGAEGGHEDSCCLCCKSSLNHLLGPLWARSPSTPFHVVLPVACCCECRHPQLTGEETGPEVHISTLVCFTTNAFSTVCRAF